MDLLTDLLSMSNQSKAIIIFTVIIMLIYVIIFAVCYKKCPSDKIMVIYGKVGKNADGTMRSVICFHGGARMIWPIIQSYAF